MSNAGRDTCLLRQLRPQHAWTCCLSRRLGALVLLLECARSLHPQIPYYYLTSFTFLA